MKGREVLLVVLLMVTIVLGGGLVGLWLGRSTAPETAMTIEGPTVDGQEVGRRSIRLFADPRRSNLAYEIQGSRVYRGAVYRGQRILYFNGRRIYRGANPTGEILFTVIGNRIYVGPNATGALAYTVANGRVWEGSQTGPIIYTIQGERLYQGPNTTGNIVFQANRPLSGDVQFLLPILADKRF